VIEGFMQLVKCIVRPDKVIEIKEALDKINVPGLTVIEARGHGRQKGHTAMYRGKEYFVTLLPKMMIEIVADRTCGRSGHVTFFISAITP